MNEKEDFNVNVYAARFDYFSLLKGGLSDWLITSDDEKKLMSSLLKAIEKYRKFIVDTIEAHYQEEVVEQHNKNN